MKKRIIIAVTALLLSPVVGYLSGFIPVWFDSSTRETVGVTTYKGFPIPFYRSADGISIMGGWMPTNFTLNLATWAILLPAISLYIYERRTKKK
jgi:hypothetical protein